MMNSLGWSSSIVVADFISLNPLCRYCNGNFVHEIFSDFFLMESSYPSPSENSTSDQIRDVLASPLSIDEAKKVHEKMMSYIFTTKYVMAAYFVTYLSQTTAEYRRSISYG